MSEHVEIRRGVYADSVTLMQASAAAGRVPGVRVALAAMATELNLDLLRSQGLTPPPDAGPHDLLLGLSADDDDALSRALDLVAAELAPRRGSPGPGDGAAAVPARTTATAARLLDGPGLALVSVPGRYAFAEAMDALEAGCPVMVFSDNVPLGQEVRLKQEAAARDLLVLGPDCGTAMIGGLGLGFANAVRPGPVGLVAASGTGAQQLMCLLDGAGLGVRACLGVGGRDLSAEVGGLSTLRALRLLDEDPATELIVLVSKPPAADVGAAVERAAAALATPVVLALLGEGRPDLTVVAAEVCDRLGADWQEPPSWAAPRHGTSYGGWLRGLFAGGTLCEEAMLIASAALGPVRSNIPLRREWGLPTDLRAPGHLMVDFGDDRLTRGRPHPMIDPTLRVERLAAEAAESGTCVVLLDVVLGHGADPDPAASLAPAIAAAQRTARAGGRDLAVVVSLCGTPADPQGLDRQAQALAAAGASVHLSNAAAARTAVALVRAGG